MNQDHCGKAGVDSTKREKMRSTLGLRRLHHGKRRYFRLGGLKSTMNSPRSTLESPREVLKNINVLTNISRYFYLIELGWGLGICIF